MTEIILIRHGETIWNNGGIYQGHTDIPLSETGKAQAAKLGERLKTKAIDAFYASDLSRAYETARIVAAPHSKEVKLLPEFREMNFGEWEGLNYKEIMVKYGPLAQQWYTNPEAICIPGGESCTQLKERAYKMLQSLVKAHRGQCIAIISHGGTIRMLIIAAMSWDTSCFWRLRQDNTALNILEFNEEQAILKLFNDTCHLKG
ncbi:alpha-ribazole phosphatase [Zhaonella formicivorans]|uniref:alpha-ribazole phosphatase n=1 Tax=Zhaonella formicivorans TaxID=2528593 RepID=UPI0010E63C7A|nr:alpha-ribazole phosphatase [Zhaonella formicivorans]